MICAAVLNFSPSFVVKQSQVQWNQYLSFALLLFLEKIDQCVGGFVADVSKIRGLGAKDKNEV